VSWIKGDVSGIVGKVGSIRGDVSNITGDVSNTVGDMTDVRGNVTVSGNASDAGKTGRVFKHYSLPYQPSVIMPPQESTISAGVRMLFSEPLEMFMEGTNQQVSITMSDRTIASLLQDILESDGKLYEQIVSGRYQ
jgi:hypothetical protein